MFGGLYEIMTVIALHTPEHRCKIPGLENDTYNVQSSYHLELVNNYIPPSADETTLDYDRCHMYLFNASDVIFDKSSKPVNASLVKCTEWVYSNSLFDETFTSKFNIVCDRTRLVPLCKSLFVVGKFLGSFLFGRLSDQIGRKTTHCSALMLMFGLTFGMSWSSSYAVFTIIITAIGAATQGIFGVGFILGVELVGPSKRKYAALFLQDFFSLGVVVLSGVSFFVRHWHYINIVCSAPALLFVLYWWLLPESPRWLISKHRMEEANVILQKTAKVNKRNVMITRLYRNVESKVQAPTGNLFQFLFSRGVLSRALILFFNWSVVNMTYYGLSLNAGNMKGNFFLNIFLAGLIEIPAIIMVSFCVDRAGRKRVYSLSIILAGCACASSMLVMLFLQPENPIIVIAAAMVCKFFASAAYNTIYLFSSELFPTMTRNAGMGASACAARLGGIMAPYVADATILVSGKVGQILPFGVFGMLSIMAGLSSIYLPETRDAILPETIEDGKRFWKCRADQETRDIETPECKDNSEVNSGYSAEMEMTRF
ncbi:organic cation transporter protein-like [Ylistrum balloti]|uniref:organic cation transporter protein-like n=1 Tax=Ylistrum balloti TaxID=509963 RepID=UPI002905AD89|nr:organic cation transporter protein-like [Ylistrum balloti]